MIRSLILSTFVAGTLATAPRAQETVVLRADRSATRQITAGERHPYEVHVDAGQVLFVVIEHPGVDVRAEVAGPDKRLIADIDNAMDRLARDEISIVAGTAGTYGVTVMTRRGPRSSGSYEIRVAGTRAATDTDRTLQEANRLRSEAARQVAAGELDAGLSLATQALTLAEHVAGISDVDLASCVTQIGLAHQARRDSSKAKDQYERALGLLAGALGPDHARTAYVIRLLGSVLSSMGDLPKADELIRRGLDVQEKTLGPDDPMVATTLRSLGVLLEYRRDGMAAEQVDLRALRILEKAGLEEDPVAADLTNNLGALYLDRGEYERAGQFLRRALALDEKRYGPDHLYLAIRLLNLGIVARESKDYDAAEAYYLRALAIREKNLGPEHVDIGINLINLANVYRSEGDYPRSLETHLRGLGILERTAGPYSSGMVVSLLNVARTYAAMGDVPNAITYQTRMDRAIETGIALNMIVGSERQKVTYLAPAAERTERTISLNMQLSPRDPASTALALTVLLQRKGRVLDASTDTQAALRQRADPESRALLDQLNDVVGQLSRLVLNRPQKTPVEEYRKAIAGLEERKDQLEAQISRRSAEFRASAAPVTLESVQAEIPGNAALIEFAVYRPFDPKIDDSDAAFGKTRYAAYVVHGAGPASGVDLGEAEPIDKAVEALRVALGDPARNDVRRLSRVLDEIVMRPLRAVVGDSTRLLVSPDGALNLIPFESLLDERGRYLVQRYSCTYVTSGRDLLRMQVPREAGHGPLVVANPSFGERPLNTQLQTTNAQLPTSNSQKQPHSGESMLRPSGQRRRSVTSARDLSEVYFAPIDGTAREAQAIRSLFPDATILVGDQATESSLRQFAAPRMLHIATHGFFLQNGVGATAADGTRSAATTAAPTPNRDPLLRAGLAFAHANVRGGDGDDGILTALEASRLNLWGTKLVALSACDTGVGEIRNGDGVYGLRRAFVLAGAESLLMSLWPVSDAWTERQMTSYYRHLKAGMGRGDSLRQVQLDMLKRNPQLHPFYWANFIQSGDWSSLNGAGR